MGLRRWQAVSGVGFSSPAVGSSVVSSAMASRILVYGVTGAGKSTMAARLSARTGIPWHSADDLAFEANWKFTSDEFQRSRIGEICATDAWILDTAYGTWIDLVLERADLIVCLDYPRWFSFCRLLRRTAMRIVDKRHICNGNVETLRQALSRQSILVWHFKSFRRKRIRMRQWAMDPHRNAVLLGSGREAERWLQGVGCNVDPS